jgi:hypothetical protein
MKKFVVCLVIVFASGHSSAQTEEKSLGQMACEMALRVSAQAWSYWNFQLQNLASPSGSPEVFNIRSLRRNDILRHIRPKPESDVYMTELIRWKYHPLSSPIQLVATMDLFESDGNRMSFPAGTVLYMEQGLVAGFLYPPHLRK